jgi:hypothetical protein
MESLKLGLEPGPANFVDSYQPQRFFLGAPFSSLRLALRLASQRPQPASARSSVIAKSLILKDLAREKSRAQSIQPYRLRIVVTRNQVTAITVPAVHPTKTCFGVW